MKILLLIILLPLTTLAGTEVIDPSGDVGGRVGWLTFGGGLSHAARLVDSDDATGIYVDDTDGDIDLFTWYDASTADSTIDSVVYTVRDSVTHANNTIAVLDSIPGVAIRQSSTIQSVAAWADQTVMYTTKPGGGVWTWTDIDNLIAGLLNVNTQKNNWNYVAEMYLTVYYHYTAAAAAQVIIIGGD